MDNKDKTQDENLENAGGDNNEVKSTEDKKAILDELVRERQKAQTYKELWEKSQEKKDDTQTESKKQEAPIVTDEVAKKVEEVLAQKDLSRAKANKQAALDRFIKENKEFHEDNDIGGLKRQALEAKFNRFNTDGIVEIEDFTTLIKDAHRLLVGTDKQPESVSLNTYSSVVPKSSGDSNKDENKVEFSEGEQLLIKKTGVSKERILKLREKSPGFLQDLISRVRD